MPLTFGSLFAGIGGFDLGFERAGMTPLWQVEIDDFCNRVLEKHWPDVARYRDAREVHGAIAHTKQIRRDRQGQSKKRGQARGEPCHKSTPPSSKSRYIRPTCPACLPPVDVICGGFPCQPHSLAGKRKGAADDRDLWPEFKRLIDELRPRWVVAENVPGIRTTILDAVLSDLEGMGYSWEAAIIPAVAVDAPHRRDRVWIVAHTEGGIARKQKTGNGRTSISGRGEDVAHAERFPIWPGLRKSEPGRQRRRRFSNGSGAGIGRPTQSGLGVLDDGLPAGLAGFRWLPEPGVGRVATGIPDRVNKLKALGNAVVPQVTEFIGRLIVEVEVMT